MLWLSDDDVEVLLDPLELVAALEDAFGGDGTVQDAPALTLRAGAEDEAYLSAFPALDARSGTMTAKVLAGRPRNARENRPEIDALVVLADIDTGAIRAAMRARALTALRTAATTAVALRRLGAAREPVALVGTGAQGRAHARALAAAGLADRFLVVSPARGVARAEGAAAEFSRVTGRPARAVTLAEACAEARVLVTATLAREPLELRGLAPDAILAVVGPFTPALHEIEPRLVAESALVVSDDPARLRRQWAGATAQLDLGRVRLEALDGFRLEGPLGGRAVFLSDGRGLEDNVAARLVIEAALREGRGIELP